MKQIKKLTAAIYALYTRIFTGYIPARYILFALCALLFVVSCAIEKPLTQRAADEPETAELIEEHVSEPETPIEMEPPPIKEEVPVTVILCAVGDNLFHAPMNTLVTKKDAADPTEFYDAVAPLVKPADIAFINQETVFGGADMEYSGYPRFNTPDIVGKALIATGFDVVNHATNHIMDKGEKGALATMDFWDAYPEITYLGIRRSAELLNRQIIIEKNGVKIGFLSYTYDTNGLPVPKSKPYLVSLVNSERIAADVDALRPNCDVLVVSMHWGEEYRHSPTKEQERLAQLLADHKTDIIIGHHPHVLEPAVYLTGKDGNKTLCAYSIGNFLSAQNPAPTLLGGMLVVELKKDGEVVSIENVGVLPLVTHYEAGYINFKVYPLYDYTDDLSKKHLRRLRGEDIQVKSLKTLSKRVLGAMMIESADNPLLAYANINTVNNATDTGSPEEQP